MLGLKEDELRVGLTTELEADSCLSERCATHRLPALVENTRAVCTANDESALADAWKNGVADAVLEEAIESGVGLLKPGDRLVRVAHVICIRFADDRQADDQHRCHALSSRHRILPNAESLCVVKRYRLPQAASQSKTLTCANQNILIGLARCG